MNKYKLINITTKEETICDKITLEDGFDYYVSDEKRTENDLCIKEQQYFGKSLKRAISYSDLNSITAIWKKVIATNNPNIDLPKVVDEATTFANEIYAGQGDYYESGIQVGRIEGYNKAKETYQFTEQDIKSFATHFYTRRLQGIEETIDQSLQLWKSQNPVTIYYE